MRFRSFYDVKLSNGWDLFQRLVYFRWLFISVLEHQKCVATIPLTWWIWNIPSFVLSSLCHWILFVFLQFYRISFEFSKTIRDVIRSTIFLSFFLFFFWSSINLNDSFLFIFEVIAMTVRTFRLNYIHEIFIFKSN